MLIGAHFRDILKYSLLAGQRALPAQTSDGPQDRGV